MPPLSIIRPDWPAPEHVVAFTTTRAGGFSRGRYAGLNLGDHVGDEPATVVRNRAAFATQLPPKTSVQWLTQNHGTSVIAAGRPELPVTADGIWTSRPGLACTVMTADCLPVLFCTLDGAVIAAAHAGWRGLCEGILEACIAAMGVPPQSLMAWMGPAIGPTAFEVGAEVREQFLDCGHPDQRPSLSQCFTPCGDRFLADLYRLAALRMRFVGVADIYGGDLCTYRDPQNFYSYRRDGPTGRMATTIALKPWLK